uniref:Uncharacterized protein n=1 Tax=Mastacembelus armatus TaxID=205130 RepID=A0A3Q3LLQ6_9TELE
MKLYIWCKTGTAYYENILMVKYRGENTVIQGCFSSSGPAHLHIIKRKMHSQVY